MHLLRPVALWRPGGGDPHSVPCGETHGVCVCGGGGGGNGRGRKGDHRLQPEDLPEVVMGVCLCFGLGTRSARKGGVLLIVKRVGAIRITPQSRSIAAAPCCGPEQHTEAIPPADAAAAATAAAAAVAAAAAAAAVPLRRPIVSTCLSCPVRLWQQCRDSRQMQQQQQRAWTYGVIHPSLHMQ